MLPLEVRPCLWVRETRAWGLSGKPERKGHRLTSEFCTLSSRLEIGGVSSWSEMTGGSTFQVTSWTGQGLGGGGQRISARSDGGGAVTAQGTKAASPALRKLPAWCTSREKCLLHQGRCPPAVSGAGVLMGIRGTPPVWESPLISVEPLVWA